MPTIRSRITRKPGNGPGQHDRLLQTVEQGQTSEAVGVVDNRTESFSPEPAWENGDLTAAVSNRPKTAHPDFLEAAAEARGPSVSLAATKLSFVTSRLRPTAAVQPIETMVIRASGPLRNLSAPLLRLVGLSCRWPVGRCRAAMGQIPVAQPPAKISVRLLTFLFVMSLTKWVLSARKTSA